MNLLRLLKFDNRKLYYDCARTAKQDTKLRLIDIINELNNEHFSSLGMIFTI